MEVAGSPAVEIVLHQDVIEFARLARPLLDGDPVRHTVALSVLDAVQRGGEPAAALLTVHEGGRVTGVALRSPGRLAVVSAVPPALAAPVERELAEADPLSDGASGPLTEAAAFAAARVARTGCRTETVTRLRLFGLDVLAPPRGVAGAPRRADEADVALLGRWRHAFGSETGAGGRAGPGEPEEHVFRSLRLGAGEILWEVGGTPVAQASAKPVVAGVSRIGPVYTPPERRGHGYAAAATAAASQWALDAGAQRVLLFTDLANPTTNRLYPRIGYRPVHDAVELRFRPA
jgi:GNAT superfamily N-acetyltransferase